MDKMTVGYVAQLTGCAPMPRPGFQGCTFSNAVQIDAAELAALRKDAERYRWLRDGASIATPHIATPDGWMHFCIGADQVVDGAMLAAPRVGAA